MSNADLVLLAEAMTTSLQGAYAASRIAADINVQRVWEVTIELDQLLSLSGGGQIMVWVSAEDEPDIESGAKNRKFLELEYRIQIAVAAKLDDATKESVDPVIYVLQQLRDYFFRGTSGYLPTGRSDVATKIETSVYFDRQRLIEQHLILSTFFLTFPALRAR